MSKNIKTETKDKHFKSKSPIEFDKCKHIVFSHTVFDLGDVDEAFYIYVKEHYKKFDYCLVKCEFELVFIDYQCSLYMTSKLFDNETMIP